MQTMLGVEFPGAGAPPAVAAPMQAPVRMPEAGPTSDYAAPVYAAPQNERPEPANSKLRTVMMSGVSLENGVPVMAPQAAPQAQHAPPQPFAPQPQFAQPLQPVAAAQAPRAGKHATMMQGLDSSPPAAVEPASFDEDEHTERAEASELAALRAQLQGRNAAPNPAPFATAHVAPPAAVAAAPQPAMPVEAPLRANSVLPGARKPQKTMLGMMAPVVASSGTSGANFAGVGAQQPQPSPVQQAMPQQAMPQPMPTTPGMPPLQPAPQEAPQPAPQPAMSASTAKRVGPSNRTMLGVATPGAPQIGSAASPAAPMPAPAAMPAPMPSPMNTGDMSIAGLPSPRRRNTGCLVAALALFMLMGAGTLAFFAYQRFARGPDIRASLMQDAAGAEMLQVEVPNAAAGTQVRFGANTAPVADGHAQLPLASDSLQLGDNPLAIEVLPPGGTAQPVTVTLTLEYRVRADLAPLAGDEPAIHILIEALPGSAVQFNDAALPLDATGHGRGVIPFAAMTAAGDGFMSARSDYTITREGHPPVTGNAHTSRIPVAQLELRSPLAGAITDQASVPVMGRVAPGARVRIEGQDVTADPQGAFRLVVPLPAAGPDGQAVLHLRASRAGAAPKELEIHITRVADLRRAADAVAVDRSITYDQLAEHAEAVGHLAAFEGQVYNVDVQDGRGILQMLTRPCTRADRCPLWVVYSPGAEITSGTSVRVVGMTTGPQQFRAENGDVRSVPRIEATHVVPTR